MEPEIGKRYKCVGGINEYKTYIHFFIPGKIYKYVSETADGCFLIDELGNDHYIPLFIFETHFKPITSNKRKRLKMEGPEFLNIEKKNKNSIKIKS